MAAGFSPSVVANILERGSADAYTLASLAKALDARVTEVLVAAGMLDEADLEDEGLTKLEEDLVKVLRRLPDERRRTLLEVAEAMLPSASG